MCEEQLTRDKEKHTKPDTVIFRHGLKLSAKSKVATIAERTKKNCNFKYHRSEWDVKLPQRNVQAISSVHRHVKPRQL